MRLKPLYTFLKYYTPIGFWLYFKRFQIRNRERVPRNGPVIFAINHQNAFLDAMVVAVASHHRPWFLTRASIFRRAVARFWLGSLKMLPIFRIRDGIDQVKRNDSTIERCRNLLLQRQSILIFPEGDHNHKWMLRPLQKGLARIAFSCLEADPDCALRIVPVGLQYEDYRSFGSDLLLSFGEPILAADYLRDYLEDPPRGMDRLMKEVRSRILELMVNIEPEAMYEQKKKELMHRPREKDLVLRLANDQKWLNGEPIQASKVKQQHKLSRMVFKWFGLPFYGYSLLNHLPAIATIKWIMKRFVRDHHWEASIRFAGMILITPLFYLLQAMVFWLIVQDVIWLTAYLFSLPLAAWFGVRYRQA